MLFCTFHILKHILKFVLGNSERTFKLANSQLQTAQNICKKSIAHLEG